MDEDVLDDVFTYQWVRVDADGTSNEEDITDETDATYTLTADERGKKVKVEVRFVDILGGEETRTSAPTATLAGVPNTAATGAPTITGTAQVGETLTASTTGIADANGLTSPTYTYQWIRVDGTDEADIASENSSTYTLVDADLGTTLKVRVTFDDDLGHTETLTSAATATVGAAATGPPTVNDVAVTSTPASGTTYYLAGEVIEFTVTFSAPVTVTATPKFAFRLGAATRQAAYASGSDSEALVFARTVQAGEVDRNGISWNAIALALDGGTITQTGATTAAILTHAEQAPLEGHRVDAAPPMQVSASVHGMSLVLVYDEPLDPASMPATGAYTVTATVGATTTNLAVSEVSIYGIWVTLALDAAPAAGATVTLAYAPPASNPVQDEAGNDAPAFSGQKVNGAAGNTAPTGAPTITGTAEVGQTLTAVTTGIMDDDGLTSPTYTYQWIRVDGTEADIAGENSSTYTLVDADLGKTLKVKVTFDDDASNSETLTSAATATVGAAGNTAATGAPTITGTAEVGETLTAVTTGIADADGLTSVSYAYQWIRVNGTEADIAGENSTTYTLVDADLGTTLKVKVSFTDDAGNSETLTSAATATVGAAGNTAATGAPTITGTAEVGETLTAVTTGIADADGLTSVSYAYQWIRVNGTEADIAGENSTTYTLVDADLGTTLKVKVSFTDDAGNSETLTSAATATVGAAGNTPATGAPTITGTAQVGETLTASTTGIADANGLTSPTYTYQWIRVDGTEADIASENSSTYTLVDADLGTTLKVKVTFADDLGHTETLTSAATATVGAAATGPPTVNDVAVTSTPASGTTYYLAGEVIEFTVTFSAPVTVTATPKFAFRLGAATRQAAYASGSDSRALVFARTVQAGEVDRNGISWNAIALALDGGTITQTGATTAAILTHAEQAPLEGHRVDAAPPMQVSASVHGMSLVLVYDEPLDPASMPATGAYTVTATVGATTTNPAVSEVSIYGIWVTLTLDAPPAAGATVTLAYAPPASNPVQDEAGNDAPAFSGQKVNGAAGNTAPTGAPTITGTAEVGQTLTAVTTGIMDDDGLTSPTYTYQWIGVATDNTETNISSATASTYTLVAADQGTTVKVTVSFTDDASNAETLTSAATATVSAAPNTPATGAPTITGTAQVGQTLTAGTTAIMDADGLTSVSYTYQWIRVATDNTETNISSAAASTYMLVAADQGTTVKVTVSFTDDANNPETLTSAATAAVSAAPNTPATGAPTITGTAQVGQTLTAGTTAIMDADGLTSVSYTYQWIRVATDNTETNISSAAASTYMLVAADQGTTVKVTVSFTDDANNPETLTSAATAAVSAAPNTPATGAPTITGTAQVGQTLTAGTTAIMDADGLTSVSYTYQWIRVATDNTETNISSAAASTYMLVAADQGTTVKVTVSFTDDANNAETLTSAATAAVSAAANTPATGAPTITGTAQVGQTLTAGTTAIMDANGLTSPTYTYQWIRVDGTEADIAGANSSTYILVDADLGKTLKVRVTFADDLGHTETLTSAATATVVAAATAALGQVMGVGVAPGNAHLVVTWTAVDAATGYTVQWMSGSQGYNTGDRQATVTSGSTTRYTIPSLTNGTEYTVRVIATRTGATDGPPSDEMTGTPRVPPPPPPPPVTDLAQVMGVGVAPGNAQLVVTWTAVSTATGYTVQWMSSGQGYNIGDRQATVTTGSTTRYTIPSLTNGTEYTVRVIATRTGADDGPPSDEMTGTPFTTPGAPQHLSGVPGDAQVMLTWDAPSSDGGSAILRYEYAIDDSGTWIDAGLDLEETVPGLTNGQQYAFEVRAVNSAGPGAPARTAATPLGMPSVPESLTATGGDGEVVLEWTEPADDGGSPVTGYEYRYAAGQAVPEDVTWRDAGTELTATVSGLENETRYTFEVRARNRVGPGETSGTTALPLRLRAELFSSAAAEGEALVVGVRRSGRLAFPAHAYIGVTDSALPGVTATEEGRDDGLGRHRLEFAAGAAEATVTVTVAFDGERRQDRVLSATLDSAELEVDGVRRPYELVTPTLVVPVTEGDAGLSVADARVQGKSSVLAFTVSMDRTRDVAVRVDYATEDGSARAGEDYTPVSGTLTIEAGGRERTVEVPVLPALHVTGERTLTLRLSNAVSAVIDDGVATGVIVRESELPKAWLARFGRTASDHAAQAIARRLEAGQRETQVTVAGRRVDGLSVDGLLLGVLPSGGWRPASAVEDMATRLAAPALAASGAPFGGVDADPGTPGLRAGTWGGAPGALDRESSVDAGQTLRRAVLPDFGFRLPGAEEALMGTSFYVERGAQQDVGGGTWAAWGDVAATRFEGDAGGLALNGDVVTGTAGLDRQWRAVLVGLALSRSSGEGGYGTGAGTIASTLTSVHPYVQVRLGERAQVWGAAGWGRGGLEITPESGAALEADLRNSMAAAGARAVLMGAGGLEIALRSDFLWTETSSDGTAALAEAVGTASRGRLMLEGAGQIQGLGGVVRPKVEGGVRYDRGDAETGRGFEVGGGLDWARGSLTLQVNGRMLVAHADESYEEWGYSGSLVYEPGADGLGLQMRVGSSAGAAASGIRNLWALENASGLVRGGAVPFAQRFDAEVGYGIGRGTLWYPYFVADDSGQTRYGLKLSSGRTIGVGLEFGRRESVDLGPQDAMLLRGELRF